jgi:hypothetical protein
MGSSDYLPEAYTSFSSAELCKVTPFWQISIATFLLNEIEAMIPTLQRSIMVVKLGQFYYAHIFRDTPM